ncbi:SusC/RagA family TonB-linked outer membrane protein [Spirosoma endbachense]|uniref:SusC/RagA family TonB-linked outer membrane protein n=1 Tax=Spirosoma endbachense TaxID=2666025 RepID=A0A6P1W614_9BACT|nr:TonB-dependent receptor [Spirosoma endbachense]QHV99479.1 SusC/RagA family TonB-linked outer membrane protein [Spirosoma endbachense]
MQKLYAVWVILLLIPFGLSAQSPDSPSNTTNASLTGTVRADNGELLPGVNIVLKGQTKGTVTDANGQFSLSAKPGDLVVLSAIGYKTIEVRATGSTPLRVQLEADLRQLNEVIVVGYGTAERKNLIGSIAKIDPSDTKVIPVGSVDAQLQGKVPGVQISSATGVPGERVNIRVRGATSINGSNDPLYVVDGVFINNNSLQSISTGGKATSPIADINPSDIESMEILKDAEATALYGSRGANGVVIITTKRGAFGQRPTIKIDASAGAAKAAKLWDLTTGPEHATLVNEWWVNTGKDDPTLNRTVANRPFRPVSEGGRGLPEEQKTYDRLGELFRTAQLRNYDISLTGGTQTTKYYIGGGYNTQEAIIRPIDFSRASFKVNLDQQVNDKIQVGVSNTFTRTYRNQGRAGDGPAGGLLQAALHTPTYLSPTNDQGVLVGRAGFDNLTLLINNYNVHTTSLRYIGNLYADAQLLPGLKFRTSFGIDYNNYNESEYWNSLLISGSPNGYATSSVSQYTTWLNEQTLTYRKKLGANHSFGLLVGNTLQSDNLTRTYAEGRGFPNDNFTQISSAATTASSQNWSKSTLASFFAKADYNFAGKYLIDASVRADGSSRFGSSRKWGYFPSVGVAWRIKQEEFLRDATFISDLKFRASWGVTGNQNGIGNFAAQGLWTGGTGYQGSPGISPQQLGNPDLQWERTRQINAGLDVSLFNDRVGFEFNVYDKYTSNGLLQIALPGATGFSNYWSNAAEISNKGFEFGINTVNIRRGGLTWTTSFNVAQNVNRIEKLATPLRYGSRDLILQQQGFPLYSFWVYKQLYVDPQTGNVVYDDVNKDGKITVDDRQLVGSIWPKFFGGLTNSLTFKGFDINLFFSYQYGNKIYNHNKFFGEGGGARDAARIIFASNLARWQKPGDITDVPCPDGINVNNYRDGGSRWLEDGSFLRLKSLAIGYTLPKELTRRVGIQGLRVYAVGTNLWLLTKYTGLDPESSASSDPNSQGIDLGTPPQPVGIQGGISLTL